MHKVLLIVEDDALITRMYERVFRDANYQVEFAANGEDGLKKALDLKPTIVLLDIMMPKLNGLDMLKGLRAISSLKKTDVIVLTNINGIIDKQTALENGATDYFVKSDYKPKEVFDIVQEAMAKHTSN